MNSDRYEKLKHEHPCFGGCAAKTGRVHLPVSGTCNIGCRFCERSINGTEDRPGVTEKIISPQDAVDVLRRSIELCSDIKVAGIAGPGDTLASNYAIETFRLVKEEFPDIIKCISTNGLLLAEKADELISLGIDSLTVTVNAVDPEIESKLNKFILYKGKKYEGVEAAEILIKNQLAGIRKMAVAGTAVKVNTVLVPGINDKHIEDIAKAVSEAGAAIYNLIPLIPQHELADHEAPDCFMINKARIDAGKYMDVFRHCQHCRADSIGVPGVSEFRKHIYESMMQTKETFSHG